MVSFGRLGGIADGVEVIGRVGGRNFEILALALSVGAGGENNVLISKSQVVVLLRLLFFGCRQKQSKALIIPVKANVPAGLAGLLFVGTQE